MGDVEEAVESKSKQNYSDRHRLVFFFVLTRVMVPWMLIIYPMQRHVMNGMIASFLLITFFFLLNCFLYLVD